MCFKLKEQNERIYENVVILQSFKGNKVEIMKRIINMDMRGKKK